MAEAGRSRRALVGVLAVAVLALTGCGSSEDAAGPRIAVPDDHGYHGTYLAEPYVVPDVPLTDTEGQPHSVATSDAPLKIVFYGYTMCPDICQIMMATISSALTKLPAEKQGQVEVDFVTTDPARDTGPVLREYLDRFDEDYIGLTGSMDDIMRMAEPMKVFIADGKKLPSGGYEVDHSTYVFGLVGDETRVVWSQGTSPAEMAADMIKLLKS